MSKVEPFDISRLPKVSKRDSELLLQFQESLPRLGLTGKLIHEMSSLVSRELGVSFSFEGGKFVPVSYAAALESFPQQSVYLVFGTGPSDEKIVLDLDPVTAHGAIDRLLGGDGEPMTMIRPLTEIEEGVLSYLFLKIVAFLAERMTKSGQLAIRLEGVHGAPPDLLKKRGGEASFLYSFRITLGKKNGYGRLLIPSTLLESDSEREAAAIPFSQFGFVTTELWAEAGRSTLTAGEINGLDAGDVVLLEDTGATLDGGKLGGLLPVRIGAGNSGCIRAELVPSETGKSKKLRKPLRLKLETVELEYL